MIGRQYMLIIILFFIQFDCWFVLHNQYFQHAWNLPRLMFVILYLTCILYLIVAHLGNQEIFTKNRKGIKDILIRTANDTSFDSRKVAINKRHRGNLRKLKLKRLPPIINIFIHHFIKIFMNLTRQLGNMMWRYQLPMLPILILENQPSPQDMKWISSK